MSRHLSGRPSSALSKRTASARTTSTKTYFDRRDGGVKDEDDPPSPFDTNAETNEALISLLSNTEADCLQGWIKTEKPRVDIVEPVTTFSIGLPVISIDGLVSSYFAGKTEQDLKPDVNASIFVPEHTALSIIKYFWNLIVGAVMQFFGKIKCKECVLTNEEDGLFVHEIKKQSAHTSRMDDRITRELAGDQNPSAREPEPREPSLKHDSEGIGESFWIDQNPSQESQIMNSRRNEPNIELAINLEGVNFKHHPQFSEEERAASEISSLYVLYRERIDADTIHYLIKRLLSICQSIQTDDVDDSNAMSQSEIIDISEKLLDESKCIKNMQARLTKLWTALLHAREQSGFVSTDVVIETTEAAYGNEFESNAQLLIDKLSSLPSELSDSPIIRALYDMLTTDFEHHQRTLNLSRSENASQLAWIPKEEKLRRKRIMSEKYFVRLLIDGNLVGDTRRVKIQWPSFRINLAHCFHCKLSMQPITCCLQLFVAPTSFLPSHLVSSVYISIPHLDEVRGSRERISSVPTKTSYDFANHAKLKGSMLISTTIELIPADETTYTAKVPRNVTTSRLLSTKISLPRDSRKEKHSLQPYTDGSIQVRRAMMAFKCSNKTLISSSFQEPPRHTLLRKRQANPDIPSPIPNTVFEIPADSDLYSSFLDQDNDEVQEDIIDDILRERSSVNQASATRFFKTVMESNLLQDYQRVKVKKQYAELIKDVGMFRFSGGDEFNLPIVPRKRSFAPSSSSVLQHCPKNFSQQSSLLFSVILGKNIPMRVDSISAVDDNPDEINLGFVVKVQRRGKSYFTRPIKCQSQGESMVWNETIKIPLDWTNDQDDFSALEKESVVLSLFDCVDIDMRSHGGFYEDEDTKLLNYLFMGSAKIPLGTVLRMKEGNVDGFVRCKSPDYIVGYRNEPNTNTLLGNFEDGEAQCTRPSTMLRVHATLDPIATAPTKSPPYFPSNECVQVLPRVEQWFKRYLEGTDCSVLWPADHGVGYLASRFLTAQNPPKIRAMTLEACAHYVSLIPPKRTWSSLKMLNMSEHLVLTSTQTLDILAGDAAEHAVLLANYFMYLGKKNPAEYNAHVCLVLGCSIPEGNTVWVMRKSSSGGVLFWEPMSGCAFSSDDDSIPLQKIYCLVSKENIYANLHQENKPHSLDFDLTNPKKWAPLHNTDDQVSLNTTTIQDETLIYSPPNHSYARELQDELKEAIKSAMREWRRTTTSFRTDIVPKLVSILEKLEQAKLGSKDAVVPLEVLSKTRNVSGFALHFAYTNTDDVLRSVKATEIHENRNPHVEFSLGIRVFAYPGGALSVWVFLSTITPKI